MAKGKNYNIQGYRINFIETEILKGNFPNAKDLAKQFEVSERTIYRDLDYMRYYYNAPIKYNASKRGFYYEQKDFRIRDLKLSEGELFYLALFDQLLVQFKNTPLESSLKSIFNKILSTMDQSIQADLSFLSTELLSITDPLSIIDPQIFSTIIDSLRTRTTIIIGHQPLSKQIPMDRTIEPYHLLCQRGNWYALAFCHTAKDVRVFSLSRIKRIQCLDTQYTKPEHFNINDHIDPSFGIFGNQNKTWLIRLLYAGTAAAFAKEHIFHHDQKIKENPDGTVEISFKTNQLIEATRLVLNGGPLVRVLEPQELIYEVIRHCKSTLALYE